MKFFKKIRKGFITVLSYIVAMSCPTSIVEAINEAKRAEELDIVESVGFINGRI